MEQEAAARVPGAPRWLVRSLLILAALGICAGLYYAKWRLWPAKPARDLVPVATQGGGNVYQGNQVPAMAKAIKAGKPKPKVETRPVSSTDVDELPPEEQAKAPVVPPAAGTDNVVRKLKVLDTQVVPPSRGEVYTRAYLYPDGTTKILQDPQQEKFWGLPWKDGNWKRLEIEGRYGLIGNTQAKATGRWIPLRMGNFQGGIEGSVATERDGVIRGEGMAVIRWEPFREQYR